MQGDVTKRSVTFQDLSGNYDQSKTRPLFYHLKKQLELVPKPPLQSLSDGLFNAQG